MATFSGRAFFAKSTFSGRTIFDLATFSEEAYFSGEFNKETSFNYALFEGKENVIFNVENLSCVSFMNTDLTGVRFEENARWGLDNNNKDKFKTIDERNLEDKIKKYGNAKVNLASIKALYRSLRDNYEYRMRYDESSQFFIREMDLKRKYRTVHSENSQDRESTELVKKNDWFRRNLSITGLYYHLFRYGESLSRIALAIALFFCLTTLFWVIYPSSFIPKTLFNQNLTTSVVVVNATERTLSDMFQIRSQDLAGMDYFIRISSLPLLGVIIIALKRKFERKVRY